MEKSYYDFMIDLTSDEVFEGLLGYGMFNEKLPPFLTSESFLAHCKTKKPSCRKNNEYVKYDNIRNINVPRQYIIPTPFAYYDLCSSISKNWNDICEHFRINTVNNQYRVSRIHIRKRKRSKSVFKMNYKDWKDNGMIEPELLVGNRYMVCADISNCFQSIYTHALSWAVLGKDLAKKRKDNKKEWQNEIDILSQKMKNGETHGLPIGPHTSNVLSEIILTSVDKNLSNWKYVRHIDDYNCFVSTYEDAQKFLVDLNRELANFGLSLNHKKTKIVELPTGIKEGWTYKLKAPHHLMQE